MYNIAVVEDEPECVEKLTECLEQYSKDYDVKFNITTFGNGSEFLFKYNKIFDIVFMDVDMPGMNGFVTARELRKTDEEVVLIFVTYLAKYAYKGYEVDAMDYILKPTNYAALKLKISKAIERSRQRRSKCIVLPTQEGSVKVTLRDITYVEIDKHNIVYHTTEGDYTAYGTLKQTEKLLGDGFCRCNNCYLVNLRCVIKIFGDDVYFGKEKLPISRPRKKDFIKAFHDYIIGGEY